MIEVDRHETTLDFSELIGSVRTESAARSFADLIGSFRTESTARVLAELIGSSRTESAASDLLGLFGSTRMELAASDHSGLFGSTRTESAASDLSGLFGSTRVEREAALGIEPLGNISKEIKLAFSPFIEARKGLSAFAEFNRPLILFPPTPKIRFSPEWQQLWDDIDAAESFDPTTAALSEHEMETPIGVFAAELAVAALAGRIRRLGEIWSVPALVDAARQLEEEDARWRTVDDERAFTSIIHRTVSVLEEVARQIAYYQVIYGQASYIREATLPAALKVLTKRGVIARPDRERMTQAWNLRSKTPGAGHGVGGAPKEAAGFVLLRVRQGLRELLDAAEAGEWLT